MNASILAMNALLASTLRQPTARLSESEAVDRVNELRRVEAHSEAPATRSPRAFKSEWNKMIREA